MHSSWYSRRRIEAFENETGSGTAVGAKAVSRRTLIVAGHVRRSLRHAVKLGSIRCMPHVACVIDTSSHFCKSKHRGQENNNTIVFLPSVLALLVGLRLGTSTKVPFRTYLIIFLMKEKRTRKKRICHFHDIFL